ncbi:hypothetical protein GJ496_008871 [Pomphorhynchus laevis]|nr:hypothetical protein GJ496_008871 [Pomphorhynchus laevis]
MVSASILTRSLRNLQRNFVILLIVACTICDNVAEHLDHAEQELLSDIYKYTDFASIMSSNIIHLSNNMPFNILLIGIICTTVNGYSNPQTFEVKQTPPYQYQANPSVPPYFQSVKPTPVHQYRANPLAPPFFQSVKPMPMPLYQPNPFTPQYFQPGPPMPMQQYQANPSISPYVQSDNMPTLNAGQSQFYPTYDFQLANANYRPYRDMYYPAGLINPFINQYAMPTYPGYIMPQCQKNINTISSSIKYNCPVHGQASKNLNEKRIESACVDEPSKKTDSNREDEDKIKKTDPIAADTDKEGDVKCVCTRISSDEENKDDVETIDK